MLGQFLNQMDEHLANKPFKRRWWSRRWVVHMTLQPPLSKDYPLWKRSQDELRLLRLFDLSPEELRLKIEGYWKKPRWRRWLASFGMNKKIDVWNYYQRCLAYQIVRPDKLGEESVVIASKSQRLLNELALVLHQSNVKFETHLEKRCRDPKWIETHFLKEIKDYKKRLKKTFLTHLNKSLKQIEGEGDRFALKQQADQEYQQVEAFMLRYFELQLNNFISRLSETNLVPEIVASVAQAVDRIQLKRELAICKDSQSVPVVSQSTFPLEVHHQSVIGSLDGAKEWIQSQREGLNLLLEEGSLRKVEMLLQSSLADIKEITEFYLGNCETRISYIQGKEEAYDDFLNYLNKLQGRLKPLLQGGLLLFHPDHAMSLTHAQAMRELITRYSQSYLEQSRCYLDRFKNYYLRLEEYYQHSQQGLEREASLGDRSDLARSIQELWKSVKELEQSFKEFDKKLKESEAQRLKDKEAMGAELKQDRVVMEEMEAKLKESEAQRLKDKEAMDVQLKESEAQRLKDKEAIEAKLKECGATMKKLTNFMDSIKSQQSPSSFLGSDADMPESSHFSSFKH